jgi:hypothetical protein
MFIIHQISINLNKNQKSRDKKFVNKTKRTNYFNQILPISLKKFRKIKKINKVINSAVQNNNFISEYPDYYKGDNMENSKIEEYLINSKNENSLLRNEKLKEIQNHGLYSTLITLVQRIKSFNSIKIHNINNNILNDKLINSRIKQIIEERIQEEKEPIPLNLLFEMFKKNFEWEKMIWNCVKESISKIKNQILYITIFQLFLIL